MIILKNIILFVVFLFAFNTSIYSQDSTQTKSFSFGFGAAVFERFEFYFPINISDNFRIEPNLDLSITGTKQENGTYDRFRLDFSIGIFPFIKYNNFNVYYGARIGIIYSDEKNEYDETKRKGFIFSPTIGGEYFLISRFSLSTELQYEYENYNYRRSYSDEKENRYISSGNTRANIIMRVYLF